MLPPGDQKGQRVKRFDICVSFTLKKDDILSEKNSETINLSNCLMLYNRPCNLLPNFRMVYNKLCNFMMRII